MNRVDKMAVVNIGEPVTATPHAEEFRLTAEKEYKVKGYDGECVLIENDLGEEGWYSLEYFREFLELF